MTAHIERLARELRLALRALRRAPAYTITSLLVLGIAIGTATAMYTLVDAVLLRPLPVRDAAHLMLPQTLDASGTDIGMTQQDIKAMLAASHTITAAAGVAHQGAFANTLLDGDRALTLQGAWVTGNFFQLLGTRPALGRFFTPEEETSSVLPDVIVLSYDTWQHRFGGDSAIIGRQLGTPYSHDRARVIGVAPPGLAYPRGVEYWAPFVYASLDVIARSAPNTSASAVRDDFLTVMRRMDSTGTAPPTLEIPIARATVTSFHDSVLGNVQVQLIVLSCAVALLLLIAGVNIGTLGLLRSTSRRVEIAVRRSLGASAGDIVRPLLCECALLASGGAILGAGVALLLTRLVIIAGPVALPRLDMIHLSVRPLLAGIIVTLIALLLAALPVVIAAVRTDVDAVRASATRITSSRTQNHGRRAMVIVQVALALLLVMSAGLLLRSLDRLLRVPLGFRADHLSIMTLAMPVQGRGDPMPQFVDLYHRAAPAMSAVPGVVSMTPITISPFYGAHVFVGPWAAQGESEADAKARPLVPFEVGGADYFRTFGIPLLRGRGFSESDDANAPPIVVVSHGLAERLWPGQDPVGKMMRLVGDTGARMWHRVVGEAADIRYRTLRAATPSVFVPWQQLFFQGAIAIRTMTPFPATLAALRAALKRVAPDAVITRSDTMDDLIDEQLALPKFSALLLAGFGLAALLLAALGLYGVMAATVRERSRELGIRSALGATPRQLLVGVLGQATLLASVGVLCGMTTGVVATRWIRSALFEVNPTDPIAVASAALILMVVSVVAAYVPARRATQNDPAVILKS